MESEGNLSGKNEAAHQKQVNKSMTKRALFASKLATIKSFEEELVIDPTRLLKTAALQRQKRILSKQFNAAEDEEKMHLKKKHLDLIDVQTRGITTNLNTFADKSVSMTKESADGDVSCQVPVTILEEGHANSNMSHSSYMNDSSAAD